MAYRFIAISSLMLLSTVDVSAENYWQIVARSVATISHRSTSDQDVALALRDYARDAFEGGGASFARRLENVTSLSLGNVTKDCDAVMLEIISQLANKEYWPMYMVDAWGKMGAGMTYGNLEWWGQYDECRNVIRHVPYLSPTTGAKAEWSAQYCLAFLGNRTNPSPIMTVSLGTCIPDVCTAYDLSMMLQTAMSAVMPADIGVKFAICHTTDAEPLDAKASGVIALLACLLGILMTATMYDVIVVQHDLVSSLRPKAKEDEVPIVCESPESEMGEVANVTDCQPTVKIPPRRGVLARLAVNLSLYSSVVKLVTTTASTSSSLDCLHGLRFLSMTWVILGHSSIFGIPVVKNMVQIGDFLNTFAYQPFFNAGVSVDTFFLLSGTLMSYLLLSELRKTQKINWLLLYVHRYWRLTAPLALVMAVWVTLSKYAGSGPLWNPVTAVMMYDSKCNQYWWTNLLYINNFYPRDQADQCMGWTWYLANDMQFFVISPPLVYLLYKRPRLGLALCGALIVGSMAATGVITAVYDYPGSLIQLLHSMQKMPSLNNWFHDVYAAPWCRVNVYVIGVLLGYVIWRTERRAHLKWYVWLAGWVVAAAVALSVVYGPYTLKDHAWTKTETVAYATLFRPAWGLAVGWVIFACLSGYGGAVNAVLSARALVPLSRVTYMAYLVHPCVIFYFYIMQRAPLYFTVQMMVWLFLGNLAVSYCVATIYSLVFEAPVLGMERMLRGRDR